MTDLVKAWQKKVAEFAANFKKMFLESGRLFQEAADGDYHKELGFDSLSEYVQDQYIAGKCPVQWREAYDRLRVVRMVDDLGLTDDKVRSIASIKLKIISGLDVTKHKDEMLSLIAACLKSPVKCDMTWVKEQVDTIKGKAPKAETAEGEAETGETEGKGGSGETKTFTFKVPAAEAAGIEAALAVFSAAGEKPSQRFAAMCAAVLKSSTPKVMAA